MQIEEENQGNIQKTWNIANKTFSRVRKTVVFLEIIDFFPLDPGKNLRGETKNRQEQIHRENTAEQLLEHRHRSQTRRD